MKRLNIFQKRIIKNYCSFYNYNNTEIEQLYSRVEKHALKNDLDLFDLNYRIEKSKLYLYNSYLEIVINNSLNISSKFSLSKYLKHQTKECIKAL